MEKVEIPLKKKPIIPKVNKIQKEILNIVKERKDIVSGSFAQKVLLKNGVTEMGAAMMTTAG